MTKNRPTSPHELQSWLDANPMAPHQWRELASRLISARQLGSAWGQLRKQRIPIIEFFALITTAYESAVNEVSRAPAAIEKANLARLVRLAGELKDAIEKSPLPRGSGYCAELQCVGLKPAPVVIGMRDDLPANGFGLGHYPMSVTWMLDRALEIVEKYESGLAPRAVTRRRDRPEVAAFVRVLVFLTARDFGRELHGTVGSVASALYDLDAASPLDKAAIQGILRDAPPAFSRLKRDANPS